MSDKSVVKVLDWPNHRHGSKISDPIRFEEGGEADEDRAELQRFSDEFCLFHDKFFNKHSIDEVDEDMAREYKGEQDSYPDQTAPPTDAPIQPIDQQNMTPYGQGQFVPTSTMYPPMGQQQHREELGHCDTHNKNFADHDEIELDEDIDDGLLDTLGEDPEIRAEEALDNYQCPACGATFATEDEFGKHVDEHYVSSTGPHDEEVKDPRPDPMGKDKEKDKDKELSPEAQKIAGTDPTSVEVKESKKPKLEVTPADRISVLGASGSGKTNLIKVLISDILPDYKFVLLDALGNFAEYEGKPNIEYHQVTPSDQATVDDVIYNALEQGDCMVVVDEVDRYSSKPGTMLNELVNVGRNYGVGGIFAARRTAAVNKDILANSSYIFTFQHILPQDLDVLIDWFSQPEETFRDLQKYEAILFKDGEQVWSGKVPEKPTTKPTAKPPPPKKPKGSKDKDTEKGKEKPKEPEGQETSKEPEKGKEPPTPVEGEGSEKEPEAPPEKEPEEPPEEGEKSEARYDANAPFQCSICEKRYKYERDFEDHLIEAHS